MHRSRGMHCGSDQQNTECTHLLAFDRSHTSGSIDRATNTHSFECVSCVCVMEQICIEQNSGTMGVRDDGHPLRGGGQKLKLPF